MIGRRTMPLRLAAAGLAIVVGGCGAAQVTSPPSSSQRTILSGGATPASSLAGSSAVVAVADLPYGADPGQTRQMPGPGVPETPMLLWRTSVPGGVSASPIVAGGQVIVGAEDGQLYGLDLDSGAILWTFRAGGAITSPAAEASGAIFVAATDHVLHAIDLTTHEERWRFAGASTNAIPTVVGDVVLIGTVEHAVVALDQATGAERWRFAVDGTAASAAAVAGGIAYLGGDFDGKVYAIDVQSGNLQWSYQTGATGMLTPSLLDGTLYVSAQDPPGRNARVVALDAVTGAERWTYATPDGVRLGTLAVDGSRVYTQTGATQPDVLALDRATGRLVWQVPIGGFGASVLAGAVLYETEDGSGVVGAFDVASGSTRWIYQAGADVLGDVAITRGTLLFGAGRGTDGRGSIVALVAPGDTRLGPARTAVASAPVAQLPVRYVTSFQADAKTSLYLDIAVNPAGDVYVVDVNNNRILIFDSEGRLIRTLGSYGDGPGQFDFCTQPCDAGGGSIAFGPDGTFVVSEVTDHRVQRFDAKGGFLGQFGRFGRQPGQFITPAGVAIDSSGQIYVADSGRNDIQVFGPTGQYLRTIGSSGSGPGQFSGEAKPSFDGAGNLWVPDYGNDRFEKFDSSGKFVESYTGDPAGGFAVRQPNFMLIDERGRKFMVDTGGVAGGNGLVIADETGRLLAIVGTFLDGQFIDGNGLAFGPNGRLYEITNAFANGADPADRVSVLQLLPPLWP